MQECLSAPDAASAAAVAPAGSHSIDSEKLHESSLLPSRELAAAISCMHDLDTIKQEASSILRDPLSLVRKLL